MILKVHIKIHGKIVRLINGKHIRGPRIVYIDGNDRDALEKLFRHQALQPDDDFTITELTEEEILNSKSIPLLTKNIEGKNLKLSFSLKNM